MGNETTNSKAGPARPRSEVEEFREIVTEYCEVRDLVLSVYEGYLNISETCDAAVEELSRLRARFDALEKRILEKAAEEILSNVKTPPSSN